MKPGRRRRLLVRAAKLTRRQARKAREKLLREMPTYIERTVHFDPENVTIRFGGFEIPFARSASCVSLAAASRLSSPSTLKRLAKGLRPVAAGARAGVGPSLPAIPPASGDRAREQHVSR